MPTPSNHPLVRIANSIITSPSLLPAVMGMFFMSLVLIVILVSDNQGLHAALISSQAISKQLGSAPASTGAVAAPKTSIDATKVPAILATEHSRGPANAPISLIEYSDYECPFCKDYHSTLVKVIADYPGKIRWVYRQMPLTFHANAEKESEASECVASLGNEDKFWKYSDAIFSRTNSNGQGFSLDKLAPLAAEVGVDPTAFTKCLDAGTFKDKVASQEAAGQGAGINGTPGSVLLMTNGTSKTLSGALPYDKLKTLIDSLLL